ncbi:MAG: hypothetical protein CMH51_04920 [Myxococcales bacterium]|nr:hypothetical protein [Myxococcales bacterium]
MTVSPQARTPEERGRTERRTVGATGRIERRTFLMQASAWSGGLCLGLTPNVSRAGQRSRITKVERGPRGVTLTAELKEAPYPFGRAPYDDPTTLIFVPHHYVYGYRRAHPKTGAPESPPGLDLVVHFHGHKATARSSMETLQLREQLHESYQNAILVVPQGPVKAADSRFGKLDSPGGFERFLGDVRRALQSPEASRALGEQARLPAEARVGKVCISAHSGGYKAAARAAEFGQFPIQEIYLLDALYGEVSVFADWLEEDPAPRGAASWKRRRKLVSLYRPGTVAKQNDSLRRQLDRRGIPYRVERSGEPLSRQALQEAAVLFVETRARHSKITCRNDLRDCLFASSLHRRPGLGDRWFKGEAKARDIDARDCR